MVHKLKLSISDSGKHLLVLLLTIFLLVFNSMEGFSQEKDSVVVEQEVMFVTVYHEPRFPGGIDAMMEFISANLRYPETAAKQGVEGRVFARFLVGKTGEVSDVTIVRKLNPECDAEVLRIIKAMPKWIPGKQSGRIAPTYFTIPISFRLMK